MIFCVLPNIGGLVMVLVERWTPLRSHLDAREPERSGSVLLWHVGWVTARATSVHHLWPSDVNIGEAGAALDSGVARDHEQWSGDQWSVPWLRGIVRVSDQCLSWWLQSIARARSYWLTLWLCVSLSRSGEASQWQFPLFLRFRIIRAPSEARRTDWPGHNTAWCWWISTPVLKTGSNLVAVKVTTSPFSMRLKLREAFKHLLTSHQGAWFVPRCTCVSGLPSSDNIW